MSIKLIDSNLYNLSKYIEQELINNNYYNYILNKDNCLNSITNKISNYLTTIDIKKINKKHIDDKLKEEINIYLNQEITNTNNTIVILTKYINDNIRNTNNYNQIMNFFTKFNKFLSDINYQISPDIINELINNNNINNILEFIISKNIKKIEHSDIYEIFPDDIIISFIEIYADKKGIKIDNNHELEDNISGVDSYTIDSITTYLREIGKIKLLSREEEQELAKKIAMGDEYAREKFIEANLRLPVSIAKRYIGKGLSFQDLIQEGNLGLMKAVADFNPDKGYRFSTYATYWIRQTITRAIIDKGRNIRLPVHKFEELNKYIKKVEALENKLGRQSTTQEKMYYLKLSKDRVEELERIKIDTVSINNKVGKEEKTELENFIPVYDNNLEENVEKQELSKLVEYLLKNSNLDDREMIVIKLRFGIDTQDGRRMTLEEIGKKYGITRERIRQIEDKALRKLSRNKNRVYLVDFLDNPDKVKAKMSPYLLQSKIKIDKINTKNSKKTLIDTKTPNITGYKTKRYMTIYEKLPRYTKEEIDAAIELLDDNDKQLLRLAYGTDLENPVRAKEWTKGRKNNDKLNGPVVRHIIKKIDESKIIENNTRKKEIKMPKKPKTIYEYLEKLGIEREDIDKAIPMLSDEDKIIFNLANGEDLDNPKRGEGWNTKLSEKYYGTICPKLVTIIKHNNQEKYKNKIPPRNNSKSKDNNYKNQRNLKTIYEMLDKYNFTKEQIDIAITMLNDEDKKIFYLANGEDIDKPKRSDEWNKEVGYKYYNQVIRKIITRAQKLNKYMVSKNPEIIIDNTIEPQVQLQSTEVQNSTLEKADYIKILDMLKSPSFEDMLKVLTVKEAVIVSLKLGYIDNKYYSTDSISNFLGISQEEVYDSTIKSLNLFKEQITHNIDKAIEYNKKDFNIRTKELPVK